MPLLELDASSAGSLVANAYTLAHLADAAYEDDPEESSSFKKTVFEKSFTFADASTSTFGFLTLNDDHAVVSIRGTEDIRDWLTNLQIGMEKEGTGFAHSGFLESVDAVWGKIKNLIEKKVTNNQKLWVTGHSLGAALASLVAKRISRAYDVQRLVTFGQPRTGDQRYAAAFGLRMHRFVNNQDIVPTIPLREVPGKLIPICFYTHFGDLQFFDKNGNLSVRSGELGLLPDLRKTLNTFSTAKTEKAAEKLILNGIEDHRLVNYIRCLKQNLP